MLNLNSDGFTSPYASQQINPWANPTPLHGSPALQAWHQAALQQLLAQQLAAAQQLATAQQFAPQNMQQQFAPQNMQQPTIAGNAMRTAGVPISGPLTWAVQQIAQSLNALAQQLTQLAVQSSIPGPFGNSYVNHAFPSPAYGNPFVPAGPGQQFTPGLAVH